jgi:hypothetical protein
VLTTGEEAAVWSEMLAKSGDWQSCEDWAKR